MTLRLSHIDRVELDTDVLEVLEDPQRQILAVIGQQHDLEVLEQFLQGFGSVLAHLNQLLDAMVWRVLIALVTAFVDRVHVAEDALEMDDDEQFILMRAAAFEAESLGTREKAGRDLGHRL